MYAHVMYSHVLNSCSSDVCLLCRLVQDALQRLKNVASTQTKKIDKWELANSKRCNSMVRLQV